MTKIKNKTYNFCPLCGDKVDHDEDGRVNHRYTCRSGDLIIEFFDNEYPVGVEEEWFDPR